MVDVRVESFTSIWRVRGMSGSGLISEARIWLCESALQLIPFRLFDFAGGDVALLLYVGGIGEPRFRRFLQMRGRLAGWRG